MSRPSPVDREVAAATFVRDLDDFFEHGRPAREVGWQRYPVDELHAVVEIPAVRLNGTIDPYLVMLGAECYPTWPVSVAFVRKLDDGWEPVTGGPWWPRQKNQPGFQFGLHKAYTFFDGTVGPMICFSFTLEYYQCSHGPTDNERWDPSRHTLTATLSRLGDVLKAPNYQEPEDARDS